MEMKSMLEMLREMELGSGVSQGALTLHPLVGGIEFVPELALLADALVAGTLSVEEMDDSGSVPELRVTNRGAVSVLILEGDELIGLKQNRTVNSSVLVGAGESVVVPVSCVERGRWSRRSSALSQRTSSSHLSLRRMKSRSVHSSLREMRGHASDQGAVWAEVDRKSFAHGFVSETSALHDARTALEPDLEAFRRLHTRLPSDARGVVVSVGGKPVAMEILPDPGTFSRSAERLVSGYALEALEHPDGGPVPEMDPTSVTGFVRRVSRAGVEEHAAVGAGRDLRFELDEISGYALIYGRAIVHAVAFA